MAWQNEQNQNEYTKQIPNKKNLLSELEKLSNSELNSFLLELFEKKSHKIKPSEILKQFNESRFVTPSDIDLIGLKELEVELLKHVCKKAFTPLTLSPLTPFATCSSIGWVHQNNVVTALRRTEVVSDATNVLALKIASELNQSKNKSTILKYCTTHRHVRGQYFSNPNFSAHFSVLCLASGGFDKGNYEFEIEQLVEHIEIWFSIMETRFPKSQLFIKLFAKENSEQFLKLMNAKTKPFWKDKHIILVEDFNNKYYKTIQFKIGIEKDNETFEIADGGDVDWTQKLLSNKKHRLIISGIGLDLMKKV